MLISTTNLCFCPSISSHDLQTFDSVCVHPSHDLHFDNVSIHLIWQYLCSSILSPADTFDTMTVFVFIHTVTYYYWLCKSLVFTPSSHLMTCRHFWQCLCPSISWPADTFDNVSISWSHDLQTLLTMFVSIYLMSCRHFWQWQCVHPSQDLQTHLTVCPAISWLAYVWQCLCSSMTCRHFVQCLCSSISWLADTFDSVCIHPSQFSWPADTFDNICVHPSYDL